MTDVQLHGHVFIPGSDHKKILSITYLPPALQPQQLAEGSKRASCSSIWAGRCATQCESAHVSITVHVRGRVSEGALRATSVGAHRYGPAGRPRRGMGESAAARPAPPVLETRMDRWRRSPGYYAVGRRGAGRRLGGGGAPLVRSHCLGRAGPSARAVPDLSRTWIGWIRVLRLAVTGGGAMPARRDRFGASESVAQDTTDGRGTLCAAQAPGRARKDSGHCLSDACTAARGRLTTRGGGLSPSRLWTRSGARVGRKGSVQ